MSDDSNLDQRDLHKHDPAESQWIHLSRLWLGAVMPLLARESKQIAATERGVLKVKVDSAEMNEMLTPGATPVVKAATWVSATELVQMLKQDSIKHPGIEKLTRWEEQLNSLDIGRGDFSVFLHSTPDANGHWFSQLVVLMNAAAPPHTDQILTAESRRAREVASERAGLVTDLLRFFSPANGNPTEISLWMFNECRTTRTAQTSSSKLTTSSLAESALRLNGTRGAGVIEQQASLLLWG